MSSWQKLTSIAIFHTILQVKQYIEEITHWFIPDILQTYKTELTFKIQSRDWRYSLEIKSTCCSSRWVQFLIPTSSTCTHGHLFQNNKANLQNGMKADSSATERKSIQWSQYRDRTLDRNLTFIYGFKNYQQSSIRRDISQLYRQYILFLESYS